MLFTIWNGYLNLMNMRPLLAKNQSLIMPQRSFVSAFREIIGTRPKYIVLKIHEPINEFIFFQLLNSTELISGRVMVPSRKPSFPLFSMAVMKLVWCESEVGQKYHLTWANNDSNHSSDSMTSSWLVDSQLSHHHWQPH